MRFAAAAVQAEVALQVAIADFAADVLVLTEADVAAESAPVLEAGGGRARRRSSPPRVLRKSAAAGRRTPIAGAKHAAPAAAKIESIVNRFHTLLSVTFYFTTRTESVVELPP